MRFRQIASALIVFFALGVIVANTAQASGTNWTINGLPIPFNTHQPISCSKHGAAPLVFTSRLLGANVELTATGVDCIGAKIDNTTSPNHSEGALKFTDATVVKPANCSVHENTLVTNALTDTVIMDPTAGSLVVFDRFEPEVAAEGLTTIQFEGAECALGGEKATMKGTLCGEFWHTDAGSLVRTLTGEDKVVQVTVFGSVPQATGGCALTFGPNVAQLTGAIANQLSVSNVGEPFGTD